MWLLKRILKSFFILNKGGNEVMQEIILAKYGEMALKGLNKRTFEDVLIKNIKRRIKSLKFYL